MTASQPGGPALASLGAAGRRCRAARVLAPLASPLLPAPVRFPLVQDVSSLKDFFETNLDLADPDALMGTVSEPHRILRLSPAHSAPSLGCGCSHVSQDHWNERA
jgi:hypothetical protein